MRVGSEGGRNRIVAVVTDSDVAPSDAAGESARAINYLFKLSLHAPLLRCGKMPVWCTKEMNFVV